MNKKDRELFAYKISLDHGDHAEDASLKRRELYLENERINFEKERLNFEKDTKDRIDVSKNEYLELLDTKKKYQELLADFLGIFAPIVDEHEEIVKAIMDGKVKSIEVYETSTFVDPLFKNTKVVITVSEERK